MRIAIGLGIGSSSNSYSKTYPFGDYKYRVETDGGTLYSTTSCTDTAINNLRKL